jgi:hypothetical protein
MPVISDRGIMKAAPAVFPLGERKSRSRESARMRGILKLGDVSRPESTAEFKTLARATVKLAITARR